MLFIDEHWAHYEYFRDIAITIINACIRITLYLYW